MPRCAARFGARLHVLDPRLFQSGCFPRCGCAFNDSDVTPERMGAAVDGVAPVRDHLCDPAEWGSWFMRHYACSGSIERKAYFMKQFENGLQDGSLADITKTWIDDKEKEQAKEQEKAKEQGKEKEIQKNAKCVWWQMASERPCRYQGVFQQHSSAAVSGNTNGSVHTDNVECVVIGAGMPPAGILPIGHLQPPQYPLLWPFSFLSLAQWCPLTRFGATAMASALHADDVPPIGDTPVCPPVLLAGWRFAGGGIGSGVIGLAIARALARRGREVVVVEAAGAIGTETSSRHSEVIHAGIYYPHGSLKARMCVEGKARLYDFCRTHNVPYKNITKLIVATTKEQLPELVSFQATAARHGVPDLQPLSGAEARGLEPALACQGALLSPSTGILDSHTYMAALLADAESHGAVLALNTRVGNYFSLSVRAPFSRLIYPMPERGLAGLGTHLTLDMAGGVRFGPDVEWLPGPGIEPGSPVVVDYRVDPGRAQSFYPAIRRYYPALPDGALQPAYSGVRPKLSGPGEPPADFLVQGARWSTGAEEGPSGNMARHSQHSLLQSSCLDYAPGKCIPGLTTIGSCGSRLRTSVRAAAVNAAGSGSAQSGQASKKKPQKQPQQQQQQAQKQPAAAGSGAVADAPAAPALPPPPQPASAARYSPLHYNIEDFCTKVVPTEGEKRQRMEVIDAIRAGVRKVWPNSRQVELQVFGSFANGLSTWSSDLDLVVTGVMEPDRVSGGYELADRAKITARLRKIADALNRAKNIDILRQQLIPRARIPILKLWTKSRVCVDVSVSDDSGPRAARYMVQQCRAFPPVKPLVLVVKTYLKACRLNEVNTGGLSSYSLTNMVIAHLQEELKSGHDISDLGETLYTFLLRYGEEHDYGAQAVSVGSGGIVPKMSLGYAMESARQAAVSMSSYDGAVSWNERLFVDCPLTGRDVSNGTYRIDLVKGAFQQAARRLEAMAQGRRITDTSINYLQALFDVSRVLKRSYPDPQEPYEDEYLKVIGRNGDEEEREELAVGGGTDTDVDGDRYGNEDGDDLDGDYLERSPTTAGAQHRR
ncbi:hypothetical protein VOLCADRAFT_104084 [Volvox carteri f. nagariensis]|uniref:L-2-hydroxyglutarate dehydrogenase, mitochondrial n=1 Tax=Volvox carteri f. nagariensis TaxID=3068 RepID=D8TR51_VOLCA|nr:uncharacterized protein VOLCADRAFT_104084 [Volvox carteri f. nagariensis]EFJ50275.1 hypothetical protein VOLCADRAFT_104084 [Volvox carteri f. nagariensis]|eukprot:XP_002948895.1 hypothetical protein VOLCADRAFT_104084 [Volvox carteri f. nagariensis]